MKIVIYDWMGGSLLKGTKYTHDQVIEGTEDEALVIVADLFKYGRNVMVARNSQGGIDVCVDSKRFTQR